MPDKHCTAKIVMSLLMHYQCNNHTKQFLMAEKITVVYVHNVHALKKELNYYGSLVYSYTVTSVIKLCNKTVTKLNTLLQILTKQDTTEVPITSALQS